MWFRTVIMSTNSLKLSNKPELMLHQRHCYFDPMLCIGREEKNLIINLKDSMEKEKSLHPGLIFNNTACSSKQN